MLKTIKKHRVLIEYNLQNLPFPEYPRNLYDPLRYFLKLGGKRSRSVLTLLACELFGKPGTVGLNAAIAVELFHNFTLIHDDIMDNAPLRRGHPTVHTRWNRDVAILSGDALFSESYVYLAKNNPSILPELIALFSTTAKEVCEGQQMDMDFESCSEITIADYLEMIRLKTSVLLGAALKMGALIAGVENSNDIRNIYDFGVNIGIAFQIQDDLLDLYGKQGKVGKQIGGDIICNKKTFLLLKAYELADAPLRIKLDNLLSKETGQEKINAVKTIFDKLQIRAISEKLKESYHRKALLNIKQIDVPDRNKETLIAFANQLFKREN